MGLQLLFWLVPQFYVGAVAIGLLGFFLGPMFPAAMVACTKLLPKHLHVSGIGFAAAFGGSGGAIYNENGCTLTLNDCTITGNSSTSSGGGIRNAGSLTISGGTIGSNTAVTRGGGIYNTNSLTIPHTKSIHALCILHIVRNTYTK